MSKRVDLTGRRFHRLVVLKCTGTVGAKGREQTNWLCKCDCGNLKEIERGNLKENGGTKSCGCQKIESTIRRNTKHSLYYTAERNVWQQIKSRCNNTKNKQFKDYGGRGIKMCKRWSNSFLNFLADMGQRPTSKHTIERKNNNKGYCPSNCIWDTRKNQNRNTRRNVWYEHNGIKNIASEWAALFKVDFNTLKRYVKIYGFTNAYQYYMSKLNQQ